MQQLRRLASSRRARRDDGCFVVEGPKLVEEALRAGPAVRVVYLDLESSAPRHRELAERCRQAGARVLELQPGVLSRACDTVSPQPVAALVDLPATALDAIEARRGPILVCAGIQDPGNAGTIVRSAAASAAAGIVLTEGSVDMFSPKAVRSSAGAIFQVPVVESVRVEDALDAIGRRGITRLATDPGGGDDYAEIDLTGPIAFVFGSEGTGLPDPIYDRIDRRVAIPMAEPVESLNVAMAATILCFEALRQRRRADTASDHRGRGVI